MNTKGDLSINMIIVTVIALIVLAVVAFLIFGLPGDIDNANACETGLLGECVPEGSCGGIALPSGICADGQICCKST